MTSPEGILRRESIMLKVFWFVFLVAVGIGGVLIVGPQIGLIADSDQIIGAFVLCCFFALLALVGIVVLSGRQRKLKAVLYGPEFITQWEDPEAGTVLLSRLGFFWYGEFYTAKGYACSIREAIFKDNQIHIVYLMARRSGQGKHHAQIDVPAAYESASLQFCEAVHRK